MATIALIAWNALIHIIWLPLYPQTLLLSVFSSGNVISMILLAGIAGIGFYLFRKKFILLLCTWIVVWVMPGTVFCGAASLRPWFGTVGYLFSEGNCTDVPRLGSSLAVNLSIIFGGVYAGSWLKPKNY